jgi:hypothetical protein
MEMSKEYIVVNKKYIDTLYEYAEELQHEAGVHTQGISKGIKYTLDKIMEQSESKTETADSNFMYNWIKEKSGK